MGRPVMPSNSSSRLSLVSANSVDESESSATANKDHRKLEHHHKSHEHRVHQHDKLLLQVSEWLQREKAKRAARKSHKRSPKQETKKSKDEGEPSAYSHGRTSSQSSNSSAISLERLQRILEENMTAFGHDSLPSNSPHLPPVRPSQLAGRKKSSAKKMAVSSDTEYQDGDVVVPSCDVILDNSKTMSYSGGTAESSAETVTLSTSKRADKERKAWLVFKSEIVKLAHTLRLKGWRRVPLENGGDIEVERLSGALTNAVYVVSPPKELQSSSTTESGAQHKYKPPPKLLLRVYGPQVEHLIDRENELGILRRLARKRIGPRLLGTFKNGRFEEYFNAQTLTADDLRAEDTSKQIAKRMRELHDGIDLLDHERDEGPFVWQNWDKWVGRCSEVIEYLDREVLSQKKGRESWRARGLVCGVEWKVFKAAVDNYRKWLDEYYRAKGGVKRNLVFAHNDVCYPPWYRVQVVSTDISQTQYGNILRLIPEAASSGQAPSPLLLPQNSHKQLIVIDFEYASANTPGLEFANHFTEWCYNYHDTAKPWGCHTSRYPTLEEQRRFIRSYVNHRPQYNPRASATPQMNAMDGLAKGSISEFLLDSRTPGGSSSSLTDNTYVEDEKRREAETERQVDELLKETHIWRIANSAQWVAWGIVQAKVPGLDEEAGTVEEAPGNGEVNQSTKEDKRPEGLKAEALLSGDSVKEAEQLDEEEDEFDYLGYAQERAMFFWGDVVGLGLVKREELPQSLALNLKVVDY